MSHGNTESPCGWHIYLMQGDAQWPGRLTEGCGWKSSQRSLEEAADKIRAAWPSSDPVHGQPSMEVMAQVIIFLLFTYYHWGQMNSHSFIGCVFQSVCLSMSLSTFFPGNSAFSSFTWSLSFIFYTCHKCSSKFPVVTLDLCFSPMQKFTCSINPSNTSVFLFMVSILGLCRNTLS